MKHVIIIGNGMVGHRLCQKLRESDSDMAITVFGEEMIHAYDRVHLSAYFEEDAPRFLATREWYSENNITLHIGEMVTSIDRIKKQVTTSREATYNYDILVLATGSSPLIPPISGLEKRGVFVYRTIEDLEQIRGYAVHPDIRRAAVLGGGLLGLEAAKAMKDLEKEVQVIEFAPRLMPRQLDDPGAATLRRKIEELGIEVLLNRNTTEIRGNRGMDGLSFQDGSSLDTDMLIISCGIVPRDELARASGLDVGPRGGVVVNEWMRTSDPAIYAIGEVALANQMIYGLVAPGYEMADIVAKQLTGIEGQPFTGADMSTKLKLIGVDVGSFGDALGESPGCRTITYDDQNAGIYQRLNLSPDKKNLLGGILVGDASQYSMLLQFVQNQLVLPDNPESLLFGTRNGDSASGTAVLELPDAAQICSCENVTKGDILFAIGEGKENIGELKKCTGAGTGCGACSAMVGDLLDATQKARGKRVRKIICEHFEYTRQELFDLIRIHEIRDYESLLDDFGSGDGCEVCKPLVASLMASIWNELILKQASIQDTNDKFLANIQKGGSYSVVPRVPGGEITPAKLVAIGRIAEKYDLYTKITGGQRIDMFGARIDQLPLIWEELIEAGFESGHAYGKSLRTVKSCVGSSWCRFGLHDSVSFAIEIENRYKGLRSPHKIKGAVSGCRRECAEAQSKDFGLIATEVGYNLYVCGNGGANPQHAVLLASDIDERTAIRYLDRFLMFYIRTAEPLNRTSVWLNKLDGGLDYLKDVVVNDCLGIGEQLEADMEALTGSYACEWQEAISNPALRARFSHFANSEAQDPTQKFVEVRGQKRPVNW